MTVDPKALETAQRVKKRRPDGCDEVVVADALVSAAAEIERLRGMLEKAAKTAEYWECGGTGWDCGRIAPEIRKLKEPGRDR